MKDFFKFTLATVTGIIVSCVVFFLIGMIILFGLISSSESETVVKKNSVMMLKLDGSLTERSQESPLDFLIDSETESQGLDDILSSIKKAKEHEDIKGIYIQAGTFRGGLSSMEEIRNALLDFKESGKFIVAYGDVYSQRQYYIASVADKLLLNPQGMIEWSGMVATPMFYKNLLDKIGIETQPFKVGKYKSGLETRTQTSMSPENREQVDAYLQATWGKILQDISDSRNISTETLNTLADSLLMFHPAEKSVEYRLADTLIYKSDVRNYLKAMAGIDKDDSMPLLGMKDMINVKRNIPRDKSGDIIAVYYASGVIGKAAGASMDENITAEKVTRDLAKLKDNKNVKAVVLRVNSPGGSAFESEQIWYAVSELKKEKPVIVSMGDYAASGGYYISCHADSIVADITTLTGSIGIYGAFPNAQKLADKVGVSFDVVKTNQYADFGALYRPMTAGEKALMQVYINNGYDLFIKRCAEGRGMSVEDMKKIAEGRIWSGEKAKEIGLVDELGGLDRAVEIAVGKAGVESYTLMTYPAKKSLFETLMQSSKDNIIQAKFFKGVTGDLYRELQTLNEKEQTEWIQARLPFELNIQ